MTTWARVVSNIAVEITNTDPAGRFTHDIAAEFQVVPNGTLANATYTDGSWANPTPGGPIPDPVYQTPYAVLAPASFLGLLLAVGLTTDQLSTAYSDAALKWLWIIFDHLKEGVVHPDSGLEGAELTAGALDALVSASYLSSDQKSAVLAGWPQT